MKLLKSIIQRYPYRGLFGWATACVWAFFISEIMWHLSPFVQKYDILEVPLVVPYAPLACILDPHDAMLHHRSIFFFALANWFGIFIIGALLSFRRVNAVFSGGTATGLLLLVAMARAIEYWIITGPPLMP